MVLKVENLIKFYRKKKAVGGVSLEVTNGEVVGLLGPNGAGKTTTFRMVVGLIHPDEGQIYLDEREITRLPMYLRAREGIGYLPQDSSVFRTLTAAENIMAILDTLGLGRSECRKKLDS